MKRALFVVYFLLAYAACTGDDGPGKPPDVPDDPDPLEVTTTPPAGSLDDLHAKIIAKRCSGQPGLCHNGQFEPNLSTPALTYEYLVNRPGIEKPGLLRVKPGSSAQSLFIDKIRNRNGVATQMPLGAEPLDEVDIAALEKWINDGALRAPGASAPPTLNNPPKRPQIGIFNTSNTRLDTGGTVNATVGQTLVLRHTVQDFETADSAMTFAAVALNLADGRTVLIGPASDPTIGQTAYDAAGPPAQGDTFDYFRNWTIPTTLNVRDQAGTNSTVPASGQTISIFVFYVDNPPMSGGIVAIDGSTTQIHIQ